MKKMMVFVVAMVALSLAQSASAQQLSELNLIITKQTPYPAQPGDIVSIEVALQNNGSYSSQGITLEINPSAPFTLLAGEERVKSFSTIGALSTVTKTYRLQVADTVLSSDYNIEFRYYSGSGSAAVIKKLPVSISGDAKIVIEEVTSVPAVIEPGKEVALNVKMKNVGTGKATDVELTLVADADATTGESLIVPVLSGGSNYIESMSPGEEKIVTFTLDIDNDAEYKSYLSTLTTTYKDETGATQEVTDTLGIPVRGSPVIEILSAKVDGTDFKVDIENIGSGSAKALRIEFIQDGEVKDSAVASDLKPTKQKTLRFTGFRYANAIVNISYLDESNEFFNKENLVTVKMSSSAEDAGPADMTGTVGILFLAVIVEGYYIWRLRKRLKKR